MARRFDFTYCAALAFCLPPDILADLYPGQPTRRGAEPDGLPAETSAWADQDWSLQTEQA